MSRRQRAAVTRRGRCERRAATRGDAPSASDAPADGLVEASPWRVVVGGIGACALHDDGRVKCGGGYSEAIVLYVLALGSPMHPITADSYPAWTATYQRSTCTATIPSTPGRCSCTSSPYVG